MSTFIADDQQYGDFSESRITANEHQSLAGDGLNEALVVT